MYHIFGLFFILYELNTLYNIAWHQQLLKVKDDNSFDDNLLTIQKSNPIKALWMSYTILSAFLYWIWIIGGLFTWQMPFYIGLLCWSYLYGLISVKTKSLIILDAIISIGIIIFIAINTIFQYQIDFHKIFIAFDTISKLFLDMQVFSFYQF